MASLWTDFLIAAAGLSSSGSELRPGRILWSSLISIAI
jgi:hypothetical protein